MEQNSDITKEPKPMARPLADIIKDLSKPISVRHLKTKTIKGQELTYIPWYEAVKYLDHFAPGWCYEIRSVNHIGGKLVLTVRLILITADGQVWREASGNEDDSVESYGDPASNAESMALRRAASKFGLGLYLYRK